MGADCGCDGAPGCCGVLGATRTWPARRDAEITERTAEKTETDSSPAEARLKEKILQGQ